MMKKLSSLVIASTLLLFVGCEEKSETEPNTPEPNNQPAGTPEKPEPKDELADPADVDEGLRNLKLTKTQNEKIKAWVEKQGGAIDPADFASFINSVINEDQQEVFRALTQLPDDLEAGDNGDKPE